MIVHLNPPERSACIAEIKAFPAKLAFILSLDKDQLNAQYREGSWTVEQIVHHLCDSHVNAYIRFQWALSEDTPDIKAYDQDAWNTSARTKGRSLDLALEFLSSVHRIWTVLMENMTDDEWSRQYNHPEHEELDNLDATVQSYAWHGEHHLNQILKALGE